MTTRKQIIEEARTWIGTPWVHQMDTKGVACDCGGLVRGVMLELGMSQRKDWVEKVMNYSRWADGKSLQAVCDRYLVKIPNASAQAGDVILLALDKHPQHIGILANYRHGGFSIIHSANNAHPARVIETRLMYTRAFKRVATYSFPGVE